MNPPPLPEPARGQLQVPLDARPYPPSWMDWLFDRVERPGVPYGLVYLGLGLAFFTTETLVKWGDGSYPVGSFSLFHFFNSANFALGLGLIHYLRRSARSTFVRFRPFLPLSDLESQSLCYRLTTGHPQWALLASLLGVLWALVLFQVAPAAPSSKLFTSPLANVVDMVTLLVFWWTLAGTIYWLIHYLRVTALMHQQCNADLMRPQALYVFSSLNLRIAVVATLINYAWVFFAPKLQYSDYLSVLVVELMVVLALVLPAWGVHQMLLKEKRRLNDQIHSRIERIVTQLYVEIDMRGYHQMDGINKALLALQAEQALLDRTSTWPWPIETPRLLATAILVPILLWLTQRILERIGV